jgi:type II secretory pathway component PulK
MTIRQRHNPLAKHRTLWGSRAPQRAGRRGVALFLLLVFLALAAIFMTGWLTSAAAERRAGRLAEDRLQAAWLAESAVERAAAQLARDDEYQGETWQIPADQLAGGKSAVITIKIERENGQVAEASAEASTRANAIVDVQLRDGDETVVRTRKQVSVRLFKSEESS